jgi:hypothetical protein
MEWQSIETLPDNDDDRFLFFFRDGFFVCGSVYKGNIGYDDAGGPIEGRPTHWMRITPPEDVQNHTAKE